MARWGEAQGRPELRRRRRSLVERGAGWARAPTGEAQSGGGGAVGFLWSHFVRSWVNTGRVRFGVDHDRGAHFDTWWCDAGGTPGDFVVDRGRVNEVAMAIHSPSRYGWPSGIYTAALILFLEGVQSYSYAPEQFDGGCGDKTAVHGNSMRRGAPVPETSCALGPATCHVCLLGLVMSPQTKLGVLASKFPLRPIPRPKSSGSWDFDCGETSAQQAQGDRELRRRRRSPVERGARRVRALAGAA